MFEVLSTKSAPPPITARCDMRALHPPMRRLRKSTREFKEQPAFLVGCVSWND
ncbi:hypothetical protein RSSM_00343 [Rhodopirellula sallentina SM41]|uniref:Uncharacterized protein n=1 Tax=Rhodopirellula sallentina SM41 TaxID=1263870 RepID=M5UK44_9BACT|nr:hypothetical protein RSSM_00343 [Rhodopirellula sallentina SM41]